MLSAAVLFLVAAFVLTSRRHRRESHDLVATIDRLREGVGEARGELTSKLDEASEAQLTVLERHSGGVRELSDLLEGQVARLAEAGDAWRAAADAAGEQRERQTHMLAEHFQTQRQIIEGHVGEIGRLGEMLERQIERLGNLGDAWLKSTAGSEGYQERQVEVMADYADGLKALARGLAQLQGQLVNRAGEGVGRAVASATGKAAAEDDSGDSAAEPNVGGRRAAGTDADASTQA